MDFYFPNRRPGDVRPYHMPRIPMMTRLVWTAKAPLQVPRYYLAAASLGGKIYSIGGFAEPNDPTGLVSNVVEEFDPAMNTWTILPTRMPFRRGMLAAVTVSGAIYVLGGYDLDDVSSELYQFVPPGTWTAMSGMNTGRALLGAAALDGRIYTVGGVPRGFDTQLAALEIYDVAAETWSSGPAMSWPRSGCAMVAFNGKVYAIGGHLRSVEVYEPQVDRWSVLRDMPEELGSHAAVAVNGKVYVFGGSRIIRETHHNMTINSAEPNDKVYEYDPVADGWELAGNGPAGAVPVTDAVVVGSKIYAVGGNPYSQSTVVEGTVTQRVLMPVFP